MSLQGPLLTKPDTVLLAEETYVAASSSRPVHGGELGALDALPRGPGDSQVPRCPALLSAEAVSRRGRAVSAWALVCVCVGGRIPTTKEPEAQLPGWAVRAAPATPRPVQ